MPYIATSCLSLEGLKRPYMWKRAGRVGSPKDSHSKGKMGYDSMAAWNRTEFQFNDRIQARGGVWNASLNFTSEVGRTISQDDYHTPSPPSSPSGTPPPSFQAATSKWSPPASPIYGSPPQSPVELSASPAPAVRPPHGADSPTSPSHPPLSPKDRHDLAAKLYNAACAGDLQQMSHLISLGAPVNGIMVVPDLYESFKPAKPGRLSPLAGAAGNGQLEAAQLLLARGAILNPTVNESSSSPLHQACRGKHVAMARFLLRAGANVDIRNCYNTTPLMYATKYAGPDMVALILAHGPDVRAESFMRSTAVFWGLWPNHVDGVELVLQAGANPNHAMMSGDTALHCAALSGLTAMAELLLRYHANPAAQNGEYKTPVEVAVENGNVETARVIKRALIERRP